MVIIEYIILFDYFYFIMIGWLCFMAYQPLWVI